MGISWTAADEAEWRRDVADEWRMGLMDAMRDDILTEERKRDLAQAEAIIKKMEYSSLSDDAFKFLQTLDAEYVIDWFGGAELIRFDEDVAEQTKIMADGFEEHFKEAIYGRD